MKIGRLLECMLRDVICFAAVELPPHNLHLSVRSPAEIRRRVAPERVDSRISAAVAMACVQPQHQENSGETTWDAGVYRNDWHSSRYRLIKDHSHAS